MERFLQLTMQWSSKLVIERNLRSCKYVKSNILLNNQWKKNHRKTRKYFEMNEKENTTYKNLWNVMKALNKKHLQL